MLLSVEKLENMKNIEVMQDVQFLELNPRRAFPNGGAFAPHKGTDLCIAFLISGCREDLSERQHSPLQT